MVDLEIFRKKLDKIDSEIVGLLGERLKVCEEVGEFKKSQGMQIEDKEREKRLIKNLSENSELSEDFVRDIYERILKESKALQAEVRK